jgi:AcrR family transcriptional regulator
MLQRRRRASTQGTVSTEEDSARPSLRAEQVAQTRAALVTAGRRLFGTQGFAATSVDELAREARVTTGALYHHFPTKAALFEAVVIQTHTELLAAAGSASAEASDPIELLSLGFESFLDAVVHPDIQRILITDAPAVLGLERFTELDEQPAFPVLVLALRAAEETGQLRVSNPEILARLLLGTLTRAALLIAGSPTPAATRDEVASTIRGILRALGGAGT